MKHAVEITHRYTDAVLWTGKVEAPKGTSRPRLPGLAVLAALKARSDLRWSDLSGCDLSGCDLSGSDLRGSALRGSNLSGSDLRGSNLRGSDLSGSNLSWSDLRGSNLSGCDLSGCDLSGADLGGLKLIARASRADHEFIMWSSVLGGHIIRAGCRTFTLTEFRAHVAAEYPGTDKAEETLSILDYLESRLNLFNAKAESRS